MAVCALETSTLMHAAFPGLVVRDLVASHTNRVGLLHSQRLDTRTGRILSGHLTFHVLLGTGMTGTIYPLQPGQDTQDSAPAVPRSVYLEAYLEPLRPWLERESVTEILVNRPGELWIEDAAHPGMQRIELPAISDRLLQRLAEQVARISHQGINREHPLLSATLPDGALIQLCGPPATRSHWVLAIRRHQIGVRWRIPVRRDPKNPLHCRCNRLCFRRRDIGNLARSKRLLEFPLKRGPHQA